jgi:hypothetical protein
VAARGARTAAGDAGDRVAPQKSPENGGFLNGRRGLFGRLFGRKNEDTEKPIGKSAGRSF